MFVNSLVDDYNICECLFLFNLTVRYSVSLSVSNRSDVDTFDDMFLGNLLLTCYSFVKVMLIMLLIRKGCLNKLNVVTLYK